MNDYIINPIWFYFIGLFGKLEIAARIGLAHLVVFSIICGVAYAAMMQDNHKSLENVGKILKKLVQSTVLVAMITIVVPSEETVIRMVIAKTVTRSVVDNTVETFKEVSDYIFLKIKESKE